MPEGLNPESYAQHHNPIATGSMDAGNRFYKYLGPPVGHIVPNAYDKQAYTNYDLP